MNDTNNKISNGLAWTFAERIMAQLVSTVVTIILARLLDPNHYGVISIVTVFISICNIFVTSGFGSSVVQKKDASETTYNTAFLLSLSISLILYIIVFIIAPHIASFYNMNELTAITRVMGIRIVLAAFNSIQQAKIRREMKFKKFFIATSFGTVISAFVGIALAYAGFGVWALVSQYLTNTTIDTIVLLIVGGWRPKLDFSKKEAKEIFSFGWKVLLTDLVFTLESDIRSLIIGKVYGPSDLAYYDHGKKYPSLMVTNVNASINKVMLPAYSRQQSNVERLQQMLRKSIQIGIFVLAPILIGFGLVANNFIRIVLTEKWILCVPYLQVFCIAYLTRPLQASNHQALLAIGRSDIVLYIMILIHLFALTNVLIAVFILKNVFFIAIGSALSELVGLISFMAMTSKYLNYSLKQQLKDILPTIIVSIIMGIFVIIVGKLNLKPIFLLILQVLTGGLVYILTSKLMKLEGYTYLKNTLIQKIKHK